ncbi:MAG TPA: hypothetical protein VGE86_02230 [Thermoanaerobaculia bacterium]
MNRKSLRLALAATFLCCGVLLAQLRVGTSQFLPKNLVFSVVDDASRAVGEGKLADGCRWVLQSETAIGQHPQGKCSAFYYRTSVLLTKQCPDPLAPSTQRSERIILAGTGCPDAPFTPKTEARIISMGTNADGKLQEVLLQPDGTRITLLSGADGVRVTIAFPDGTGDGFKTP